MTHLAQTALKLGAAFAALALTACGSSDRQSPSLDLPLSAPQGVSGVMADFIEVCSLSMTDRTAAISALSERGWQAPSSGDVQQMAAFGGYMSESETGEQLQIYTVDFPHVEGVSCQLTSTYFEEMPNFSALAEIPGLLGDFKSFSNSGDESQLGRFSGIAPNGYPLTVQLITNSDFFYTLIMTTTRPVRPSESNQE